MTTGPAARAGLTSVFRQAASRSGYREEHQAIAPGSQTSTLSGRDGSAQAPPGIRASKQNGAHAMPGRCRSHHIAKCSGGVWLLSGSLRIISNSQLVPRRGLEPPRLAAHGPEPCASTNSATWARRGALEGGRVAVNAVLRRLAPAHEFSVAVQRTRVDGAVFAGDGAPFRQVLRDRDAHAGRVRRLSRGKPGHAAGARQWRRAAAFPWPWKRPATVCAAGLRIGCGAPSARLCGTGVPGPADAA